jgi:acyl-CoA synthetase (AMP-forming)/AMP-acid ligase II
VNGGVILAQTFVKNIVATYIGMAICCAYAPLPGAGGNPATLRQALRRTLPNYMLPSHWICFERLPQNCNGKIDRRELREQFQQSLSQPA